jgi:hypothetical protein
LLLKFEKTKGAYLESPYKAFFKIQSMWGQKNIIIFYGNVCFA